MRKRQVIQFIVKKEQNKITIKLIDKCSPKKKLNSHSFVSFSPIVTQFTQCNLHSKSSCDVVLVGVEYKPEKGAPLNLIESFCRELKIKKIKIN